MMLRSSKHTTRFTNQEKLRNLGKFVKEYRRVTSLYLDYLWDNGWSWESKSISHLLDIESDLLDHPRMIDKSINGLIDLQTTLSARVLKCCVTQVCGILGAAVERRRRLLWVIAKLKSEGEPTWKIEDKLQPFVKPTVSNINPELNSICCDFLQTKEGSFDGFLQLKCLGKSFGVIRIPIKFHRNSNKWFAKGKMMTSFLLSKKSICIRWSSETPEKRKEGIIVGVDQGLKTVATLSNGIVTKQTNNHGYSLEDIINIITRKKKGSKAFHKAQEHRRNLINWSINQLNLNGIKEIRLEKIVNINKGKRTSRKLSHWTNTEIRDKILSTCEELGVRVIQQDSTYRSQRCSRCGTVRKANRKGKVYLCKNCGLEIDADLNAAKNHEQDLPKIPKALRELRRNLGSGFLWKPEGFFELTGEELTVPLSEKNG